MSAAAKARGAALKIATARIEYAISRDVEASRLNATHIELAGSRARSIGGIDDAVRSIVQAPRDAALCEVLEK